MESLGLVFLHLLSGLLFPVYYLLVEMCVDGVSCFFQLSS